MSPDRSKGQKLIIAAVIVVSGAGIAYFGSRAVLDHKARSRGNPFAYDIEEYRAVDPALVLYEETGRIPVDLPEVRGIATGPGGLVYVSGEGAVLVFDGGGIRQAAFRTEGTARCLAVDAANGDVYLGFVDHVAVLGPDGAAKAEWESPGGEAVITSVALSARNVFVADAGNLVVWKYDRSGNLLGRIGARDAAKDVPGFIIPSPFFDVAVDPDGFLWAANTGRHSLENYNEDGGFRTSWGESFMDVRGFSGCCNPSHFAILEDGSFVTSEKGIPRVKIYNRLGELVSVVAGPDRFLEGTVGLDLAVDSSQRILVLDPLRKAVRIFERTKD